METMSYPRLHCSLATKPRLNLRSPDFLVNASSPRRIMSSQLSHFGKHFPSFLSSLWKLELTKSVFHSEQEQ